MDNHVKEEANEHAKRIIALGWHKNRTEEVIAGAWEAGYIFGQIDAAATPVKESNEQGEIKFTLLEMLDCFDAGYDYRSSLLPDAIEAFGENSLDNKQQYFLKTFGIEL